MTITTPRPRPLPPVKPALHIQIALSFRPLLRTERYPEGSTFPGVRAIQEELGVSPSTAYNALRYLAELGDVEIRPAKTSVVLADPGFTEPDGLELALAALDSDLTRSIAQQQQIRNSIRRLRVALRERNI